MMKFQTTRFIDRFILGTGFAALALVSSCLLEGGSGNAELATVNGHEWSCDGLPGGARGLCNAYCNAQECQLQDPLSNSCQQLLGNYHKHTDVMMPCEGYGNGTIALQPDAAAGKDAIIFSLSPDSNIGNTITNVIDAWTHSGQPCVRRALIEFDLSDIPAGASIIDARLSLYFAPGLWNEHSSLTSSNEAVIHRVVDGWDEASVTWNNQPATTPLGAVTLPETTSSTQNTEDIDVTVLVEDMLATPGGNHGFMISLAVEQYYAALMYASSDHTDSALHPKLVVSYQD